MFHNNFLLMIGYLLLFLLIRVKITAMDPDDTTEKDECHGGQGHHAIVHVAVVITALRNNLKAQDGTAAQQFAHKAYDDQNHGITKSVAQSIKETGPRLVHHGESLQTSHQNTVGNNQSDIYRQLYADIISHRLEYLTDDGDQSGHDHQLDDDADTIRYRLAYQRDNHIRKRCNDSYRQSHHNGRLEL